MSHYKTNLLDNYENVPTLISNGHPFALAVSRSLDMGLYKSGVKGPLTLGSSCNASNSPLRQGLLWVLTGKLLIQDYFK